MEIVEIWQNSGKNATQMMIFLPYTINCEGGKNEVYAALLNMFLT